MFYIRNTGVAYEIIEGTSHFVVSTHKQQRSLLEEINTLLIMIPRDLTRGICPAQVFRQVSDIDGVISNVFFVATSINDEPYQILSPIFDIIEEAKDFLNTTVCSCGYDIGIRQSTTGVLKCDTCLFAQ